MYISDFTVGENPDKFYAVNIGTGEMEWESTGGQFWSATIVRNPSSEHSAGSRALLGNFGHHDKEVLPSLDAITPEPPQAEQQSGEGQSNSTVTSTRDGEDGSGVSVFERFDQNETLPLAIPGGGLLGGAVFGAYRWLAKKGIKTTMVNKLSC